MIATVPTSGRTATADLVHTLRASMPEASDLVVLSRVPSRVDSSFPLEQLHVRRHGREEWLVWKDLSRRGAVDPIWASRPDFLQDPLREIVVYAEVLTPFGVSAPSLRAVATDPTGRAWLFLERIDGESLGERDDPEAWSVAAAWLADLHARFFECPPPSCRRLLRHDARYFRRWLDRFESSARWRPVDEPQLHRLVRAFRESAEWLAGRPVTLLHGDLHAADVLLQGPLAAPTVRTVDWEMAGAGPGLLDLAALTSSARHEAQRAAAAAAYREALPARIRPSADALRDGLDRCTLLLALQRLTWSPSWTPPQPPATDWLGEALTLAERLTAPGSAAARRRRAPQPRPRGAHRRDRVRAAPRAPRPAPSLAKPPL